MTIYFIQAGSEGAVKIGYTAGAPEARMAQLQTGCPAILRLIGSVPGCMSDEQSLHRSLWDHQINGEWFSCSEHVLGAINRIIFERPYKPEAGLSVKSTPWYVQRIHLISSDVKIARMETEWVLAHIPIFSLERSSFSDVTEDSFRVFYEASENIKELVLGLIRTHKRLTRRVIDMRKKGNQKIPAPIRTKFIEIRKMMVALGATFDHNFHNWSISFLGISSDCDTQSV